MTHLKDELPDIKINFIEKIRRNYRETIKVVNLQREITSLLPEEVDSDKLFNRLNYIGRNVSCAHNPSHALEFIVDMLKSPREGEGCFVEAGCFKGGSTAKFSIIAKILERKLIIFDSFEGLPNNNEKHLQSLEGHSISGWFHEGAFTGSLEEVKNNIRRYGEIDVCIFIPGWFDDTMPNFQEAVIAGFIDVDLASSTKTCLKYLYPKLVKGGVICSQDGDFPLVVEVFNDNHFWEHEVGVKLPVIEGLGEKITRIKKID